MRPDILFVVDGAHTLGSTPMLQLKHVDFFFTNCHKWFCGPKGTAFLFKNKNVTPTVMDFRPVVLSHGINTGFNSEFVWSGLKDYTVYLGGNIEKKKKV